MLYIAIVDKSYQQAHMLHMQLLDWARDKTDIEVSVFSKGEEMTAGIMGGAAYDAVFIDIELGGCDGITTGRKLRSLGYQGAIVYLTEVVEQAIYGYEVGAFRYYIKPIEKKGIYESMNHVLDTLAGRYFQYTYCGETIRLPWESVISFECIQHYINVYTAEGNRCIKKSLKTVQQYCPSNFIRCHKSFIVNIDHILKKSANRLYLDNDTIVEIAPRYAQLVKQALENSTPLSTRSRQHYSNRGKAAVRFPPEFADQSILT